MKLELSHIQHYPIGGDNALRLLHEDCNVLLFGVNNECLEVHIRDSKYPDSIFPIQICQENIKPILRPMSDLCKSLEDGTIPIVELAKILGYSVNNSDYKDGKVILSIYDNGATLTKSLYYNNRKKTFYIEVFDNYYTSDSYLIYDENIDFDIEFIDFLDKNHYDWRYGLIDQNLAIDINTIKQ